MKNTWFYIMFILFPLVTFAQDKLSLPMKNGAIYYEKNVTADESLLKEELFNRALKWIKSPAVSESSISAANDIKGEIDGSGIFKVVTSRTGNYYLIKYKIHIAVKDGQYTVDVSDLLEKPIEKGITNEYSKIGYRWWDYRQGKPWSAEDQTLFTQIDININGLIASLQKEMALPLVPQFRVIAFYTTTVESDHVDFAKDAILFYRKMAAKDNFAFDTTTNWKNLNAAYLKNYQLVIWLNDFPQNEPQRQSFEQYMEQGGAWLGFHVAGYNDQYTKWPWFVSFFGGAVFYNNNWPPLPAKLMVDDHTHPATRHLPSTYLSTLNEWYGWKPSPRENKDIKVLVTLDPSNYPLGKKDVIRNGDIPVVWTNTRYKMLYMNMGHGDQIFTSAIQNRLFEDAVIWLGLKKQ